MKKHYHNKGFRHNTRSRFPGNNRKPARYAMSEVDLIRIIEYSKQSNTTNVEEESYLSINTFEDFHLNYQLQKNIKSKGFVSPTPIQDKTIPAIMSGHDLIGQANTGTGKTAAFLIPLIEKISKNRTQKALIIAPTRELAEQINSDFRSLAYNLQLGSALLIGGKNINSQIKELQRNPDFVIGTPGRIKDLINRRVLVLSVFNNVVLDETDRMVDIGFIKEIKLFISLLPKFRQSLFFSATISRKVEEILYAFVQNAITVSVKKTDTCKNIKQDYIKINKNQLKVDCLHDLLIKDGFEKVIVFGNTKRGVQKLTDELVKRGFKAASIHGDKNQNQRHAILEKFKKDEVSILIATDVAARGLDINNVSHVVNYELPETYDEYIHRIGRTGRINKSGIALTLVNY
ncbi:hypothetical protein A2V49_04680 [candidate division WWE3 bacterium RBG_19FT_COMBO_34_6]|uniref:RNA helicase n=1 Tax=candidate division WWE3 bacterium RBG_19FT_COMBO_34_6 TaxID=1802612 RepID=A0A1F4UMT6_UNCKA|nr:MAG: hypothetical protein A2V49_04680 [candidate division WWE3 bacterium RBG_19FT_COMBO_34_6]